MAVKKKAVKAKVTARKKVVAPKKTVKKVAAKTVATSKKVAPRKSPAASKPATAPAKKTAAPASRSAKKANSQIGPVPGIAPYTEKKGEEYMNELQVEHFRNILLSWKHSLMEEVDRTVHHMQDDAANFPDPNDRATQESEFSMELRARDRERKLIKKIEESIRHLDNDEFGYCEACGVEIGVKRLEARPTATLCIDCKILDEIREKQMG
jgi:DnaK suppressor protein